MLARIGGSLVSDLSEINSVVQDQVESATRVGSSSRGSPGAAHPFLAADSCFFQIRLELGDTAQFEVGPVDLSYVFRFGWVEDEMPVFEVIAEWNDASVHKLDIMSFRDLYAALDKLDLFRNRFIVFPHVADGGFLMQVAMAFAAIALFLAILGTYGLL